MTSEGLRLYCTVLPVSSGAQMPRYFQMWKYRKPSSILANLQTVDYLFLSELLLILSELRLCSKM